MNIRTMLVFITLLMLHCNLNAQNDSLESEDIIDYSQFGDAYGVRRYATQKVIQQAPTKIISVGYEIHGNFQMRDVPQDISSLNQNNYSIRSMSGFRAQVNLPVVSNDKIIWQVGTNYWGSYFRFKEIPNSAFEKSLQNNGLHTLGIQSTIFKPLDEKHWLIIQVSGDLNSSFRALKDVSSKGLTISGTAIYGWKSSDKNMIGVGLARTYRAGAVLHVPVLLWNKTFNDQYGMELLLPARGFLRRNFSTTRMLQMGYELEGNQYHIPGVGPNGDLFLQRGELKPKLMWDQKISGYIWLNLQAGVRLNWRFDAMNKMESPTAADRFYEGKLTNPLFITVSLNFVSP